METHRSGAIGRAPRTAGPPEAGARVWLAGPLHRQVAKSAKDRQVAQLTVRSKGTFLRAEERTADMFASIDAIVDKMYRQIVRYKGKRYGRGRGPGEIPPVEEFEEEVPPRIVRTKRFQVAPMDEEEAVEQMELLGHDFFVFFNVDTNEVNVIYRRKDGNYGLIEPELA